MLFKIAEEKTCDICKKKNNECIVGAGLRQKRDREDARHRELMTEIRSNRGGY